MSSRQFKSLELDELISDKVDSDDVEPREEYRLRRETVWWQIVRLHQELDYLRAMDEFDYDYPDTGFFDHVLVLLIESVAMGLYRVAEDNSNGDENYANLRRWKNRLIELTKEDYRDDLRSLLREAKISGRANKILEEVREVRHDYIGHISDEAIKNVGYERIGDLVTGRAAAAELSLEVYEDSVEELVGLFDVLCLGEPHHHRRLKYAGFEPDEIDLYRHLEELFG